MKAPRKFSLTSLLVVITTLAVGLGYVIGQRELGSERLVALIEKIGGQNYSSGGSSYRTYENHSPNAILFGNRKIVLPSVHFGVGKIDAASGRALAKNVAANGSVFKVTFYQTQIADDCPCFIWDSVTHIEFEDTKTIPDWWIEKIAVSPNINRVSFSGVDTDISFEELRKFKHVQFMRLSNLGIYGQRLNELKKHLEWTTIKTSGLWGNPWPYKTEQTLSQHDPEAFHLMSEILGELKAELQKLERPATNQFQPPATVAEIASLEHRIGQPLPKYMRALLEVHNGQRIKFDSLFHFGKLMSTSEIIEDYKSYDRLMIDRSYETVDWPPSRLAFANKKGRTHGEWRIELETGNVSQKLNYQDPHETGEDLPSFLRALTRNLKEGNFAQDRRGRVKIGRNEDWYPDDE